MLLLVKINGRIDMFFVKRKTIAFPLLLTISSFLAMPMHVGVMNINVLSGMYLEPQICFSYFFLKKRETQAFYGSRAMLRFVNVHSFDHN